MLQLGWLSITILLISFIILIASIFTIRATWNSSTSKKEAGMIPLYVGIILIFITTILITYTTFKETEITVCKLPNTEYKVQSIQPVNSANLLESTIH